MFFTSPQTSETPTNQPTDQQSDMTMMFRFHSEVKLPINIIILTTHLSIGSSMVHLAKVAIDTLFNYVYIKGISTTLTFNSQNLHGRQSLCYLAFKILCTHQIFSIFAIFYTTPKKAFFKVCSNRGKQRNSWGQESRFGGQIFLTIPSVTSIY